MQMSFNLKLLKKLINSLSNNYGSENWDSEICGPMPSRNKLISLLVIIRALLRYVIMNLSFTYNILEDKSSKDLLVQIISYRILGYKK